MAWVTLLPLYCDTLQASLGESKGARRPVTGLDLGELETGIGMGGVRDALYFFTFYFSIYYLLFYSKFLIIYFSKHF